MRIKVPFFAPRNNLQKFDEFFLVNFSISAKEQQIRNPLLKSMLFDIMKVVFQVKDNGLGYGTVGEPCWNKSPLSAKLLSNSISFSFWVRQKD